MKGLKVKTLRILPVLSTLATEKKDSSTGTAFKHGQMVPVMKACGKMTKQTGTELFCTQMATFTKDTG